MKVHVVGAEEQHIEGYERVEISQNQGSLKHLSDNECTFVLANDTLDQLDYNSAKGFVLEARQKLRLGGTLVVGGTDIRLLARNIINDSIGVEDANQIMFNKKSCLDINTVTDLVSSVGLQIISTRISGVHYEVEARRN
jgi:hypothetical protein